MSWLPLTLPLPSAQSHCNKLYIGESGRKLGDHFREHLLDVKNKGSDLSKPVAIDISIFRATRTNTWKFAEFTYTLETMKLEKGKNRDWFSNSGP